ncbi:MAG: right-handed parallel beta-helix repeat-containing protein [Wenzhouxiangella sp.]|nr:right-handed parallel beta-helix repeat-containing protein [Wenzhouxiangella sp.]
MKIRKLVLGVVLTLLAGLAQAATIVVTTAADTMDSDGLCSLREAMLNAENADQSGSTDCPGGSVAGNMIVFDESLHGSTIFLANQEFPHITRPLEIIGPERGNPSALTIDAGAASRVFVVRGANEVMLSDLTLTNGRTFSETSPGSTVYIADGSVVRMERIHVSHGIAQGAGNSGGAIAVVDSSLEIEEGVFLFNQASGSGGVIFSSNSELEIVDTLAGINAASGRGGVVHAVGGKVAIVGSGFSANTTSGESAFGGALFMDGADLDMINTDLSGNVTMGVNAHGGGLYLRNANLTIVGGAIEGNVVQGAGSNGGGISTFNADVMLSGGCHILDNTTQQANGWGGGMRIGGGGLEMSNCLVSGNQTFGNNAHGGGIYVIDGNAVIENSQLVGNQTHGDSAQGGGIRVRDGDLTMTDSLVENNATNGVSGHGGGIHHRTGETDLQRIRVSGNQTIGDGGQGAGIYLRESELTLFDAWIDNNQASNARGAGLALLDGLYSIERATISGNHGTDHGGGLMVAGSQLWIVNSTISGNELEGGTGSALFGDRSDIELIHVTVADNINPPGILSHLYVFGEEENRAELTLYNTLIFNNRCGANDFGTISGDGNMGTHSSCPAQVVPAAAIDIKPLADNGGFAPTHELDIGSLAINAAGNCSAAFGVDEDQRGAGRPGGSSSACDVGAFETDQPPAPVDLSVALSIDPPFAAAGEQVEILIDVSNQSDSWASEVEAQINLGSALILQSADHDSGTFDPGTGLWTVGLVGPEEKQTLSLTVELATSGTRDVAVLVSGFQPDPEPGNDQASAEVMEPPPPAEIVVNTLRGHTASDGLCGLHEAIINANNANQSGSVHCAAGSAGLNAIDFHPDLMGGVIQLEQDLPPINANLSITGPGLAPDSLTILGSAEVQGIFAVPGPVTFELRYLTLSGGQNLTGNLPGGALRASGGSVISLATMKISSNSTRGNSSHGGGVAVEDAVLSVIDSEFTDNEVLGGSARGGALFASNATVSIERSTIANNRAQWSTGGGIHLAESSELSMVNSTISGNRSPAGGAGMYVAHSVARLTHSTVAWNIAGPPNLSLPQGIFVFASAEQPGELILENTLLVQPSADQITCASPSAFASVSSTGSLSTHAGCFGVATPVSDIALLPWLTTVGSLKPMRWARTVSPSRQPAIAPATSGSPRTSAASRARVAA